MQADKHRVGKGYNNITVKQELDKQIESLQYKNPERYEVYLSIKNPLEIDYNEKEYDMKEIDEFVKKALEGGYDGLIVNNIKDEGGTTTQYAVFNPEQIKSVDNQGTFSKDTSNIYYQIDNDNIQNEFGSSSEELEGATKTYFQKNDKHLDEILKQNGYDESVYFENKKEKVGRNNQDYIANYKSLAERIYNNAASKKEITKLIKLGTTPNKLIEAGAKKYELDIATKTIVKMRDKHNLSIDEIKQIPELLHNPIAVFKSLSRPNDSIVVLIDLVDNKNRPVIVPIQLSKNKDKSGGFTYLINEINSVYGRNNFEQFLQNSLKNNNLLKLDVTKKASLQKYSSGLQLPKEEGSLNNIITDNSQTFNPETYYQDEYVEKPTLEDIHQNYRERIKGYEYLGYFQAQQDKNIITIMENANESTLLHEMGHLFLEGLNELAKTDETARENLEIVDEWLEKYGDEYTVEQHEEFARGFEAYLYNGVAPSNILKDVFEEFKEWLSGIKNYWAQNHTLSPEAKNVFDSIFSETQKKRRRKKQNKRNFRKG